MTTKATTSVQAILRDGRRKIGESFVALRTIEQVRRSIQDAGPAPGKRKRAAIEEAKVHMARAAGMVAIELREAAGDRADELHAILFRLAGRVDGWHAAVTQDGACGGCGRVLPTVERQELAMDRKICTCPGCGRILLLAGASRP